MSMLHKQFPSLYTVLSNEMPVASAILLPCSITNLPDIHQIWMRNDLPKKDPFPALEVALYVLDFFAFVIQCFGDEVDGAAALDLPVV